jgi:hypothetical protein
MKEERSKMEVQMLGMLVPEEMLESFEVRSIEESEEEFRIRLEEKPGRLPEEILRKKKAVLDGFCRPIELQTFPIKGKAVYLQIYRRRWKEKGGGERNFSNHYEFNEQGMKATREFGSFLKEAFGD